MRIIRFIILSGFLFFSFSCTYTFKNTRLEDVKTLFIYPVENLTLKYELSDLLSRYLNDSFINSGSLSSAREEIADSRLKVTVNDFIKETGSIDSAGNPTSIKMTIKVDYEFFQGDEVLEAKENYYFDSYFEYDISVEEDILVEKIVKSLADDLKERILEGF